jgi:serine/threonine protein kinase
VADFGLSRVLEGVDQIQTHTFGTVTHMPPEMLVEGHMTKASDVYAFGVIMW